jgi:hypothetical protein
MKNQMIIDRLEEEIPDTVKTLIKCFQNMSFIGKIDNIDRTTAKHLYTSFMNLYQPHVTSSDGNCLWNMISISLCGTEELQSILRKLTFLTILKMKTWFYDLIKADFEKSGVKNVSVDLKLEDILQRAKTDGKWGNEFHLQAISTFLNKKIYIYSSFTESGKFKYRKTLNEEELKSKFSEIGLNLVYEPIKNTFFSVDNEQNSTIYCSSLFGYSRKKHYVSLIPVDSEIHVFPIRNNLFT